MSSSSFASARSNPTVVVVGQSAVAEEEEEEEEGDGWEMGRRGGGRGGGEGMRGGNGRDRPRILMRSWVWEEKNGIDWERVGERRGEERRVGILGECKNPGPLKKSLLLNKNNTERESSVRTEQQLLFLCFCIFFFLVLSYLCLLTKSHALLWSENSYLL